MRALHFGLRVGSVVRSKIYFTPQVIVFFKARQDSAAASADCLRLYSIATVAGAMVAIAAARSCPPMVD